jgi:hypothetical protein
VKGSVHGMIDSIEVFVDGGIDRAKELVH